MTLGKTIELHHMIEGPEEAPVLVLSNSLGTTLQMWRDQAPALRERFRLVRYDHRGHGGSSVPPGPYAVNDLGRDVLALLDGLGVERFSFCGLSLGGMVGMWIASEAPERVERLALCRESRPVVVEWAGRMLRGTPPEGYAGCCEAIAGAGLSGRLGAIRAPTLIIAGADDPAAPPERLESIRDAVPDARLEILSPAAHLANIERPEAMTQAIFDHLQAVARGET